VLAENLSVHKAVAGILSLGQSTVNKNGVIRSNVARILDSIVFRLGAERFMGSSPELQELVVVEGSKMLTDGSLDVSLSPVSLNVTVLFRCGDTPSTCGASWCSTPGRRGC
jgi:hypothetical protein